MNSVSRLLMAFAIFLVGAALVPYVGLSSQGATWQRFAGAYEDQVTVTRAEYRSQDRELRVRAVSTSAGARLTVYATNTGQFIGADGAARRRRASAGNHGVPQPWGHHGA